MLLTRHSTRRMISSWSRGIRTKSWTFEDTLTYSAALHLLRLLESKFPSYSKVDNIKKLRQLPPGFHFLYCNPSNIHTGEDGYDNYQSPVDEEGRHFGRRMWVRGQIEVVKAIEFQKDVSCIEHITNVRNIQGTAFVNISREFSSLDGGRILEQRTLAYTNERYSSSGKPHEAFTADRSHGITLSSIDVMRYSALTYNCHKVHYDRQYAVETEGLPGVLVQGPLMVTLLLYWYARIHPEVEVQRFRYRNVEPWLVDEPAALLIALINGKHVLQISLKTGQKIVGWIN